MIGAFDLLGIGHGTDTAVFLGRPGADGTRAAPWD